MSTPQTDDDARALTDAAALALCREFPDHCAGSGGMGGDGGPCGAHLEVADAVDRPVSR